MGVGPPSGRSKPSVAVSAARVIQHGYLPLIGAVTVLLLWALVSAANTSVLPRSALPEPTSVLSSLMSVLQRSAFWQAVGMTLASWAEGLVLACVVAIPVGILIGSSRFLFLSTRGLIEILRPVPSFTLLPLLVLLLGLGGTLKVFIVALGTFWIVLIQAVYGVRDVDPLARDTARAYGLGPVRRFVWITLPAASPYLATGLRLGAVLALNIAIGVELVVGVGGGLGGRIFAALQVNDVSVMYAYILSSGVLGLGILIVMSRIERRALRWHPSMRQTKTR